MVSDGLLGLADDALSDAEFYMMTIVDRMYKAVR